MVTVPIHLHHHPLTITLLLQNRETLVEIDEDLGKVTQNISQLQLFGDMSTPPDITSPSTPASPANTLDPGVLHQHPSEMFGPFNPAAVPSDF
ncbi:UNVERIFIED_CONTAM: hypothetical protein FKN15_015153 [Acipenser sinensis]